MTQRQRYNRKRNQTLPINCCQSKRISEVFPAPTLAHTEPVAASAELKLWARLHLRHASKYSCGKHVSFFSGKKVCVSRQSQGRQLYPPLQGTATDTVLLRRMLEQAQQGGCFWGIDELSLCSLLTSQSCFPKGRHNFPHLRTRREGHVLLPLSERS